MIINQQIVLKNGLLCPKQVQLNLLREETNPNTLKSLFTIKIMKNHSLDSNMVGIRKYIFAIQELEEYETDFLQQGDCEQISWITQPGVYHLFCVNYPKITCTIFAKDIQEEIQTQTQRQRLSNTRISLNLQAVEEEKQEKQQQLKQQEKQDIKCKSNSLVSNSQSEKTKKQGNINQWVRDQQQQLADDTSPFGTPKKVQIQDYDRMLSSDKASSYNIQNRYLKYFQQEFKLWRNFFEDQPEGSDSQQQSPELTPVRQKPKSERRKNSDVEIKQNENWSKRQNFSPNQIFFTESCGSPSYNENLSDKQKSVSSYLYSHQGTHDRRDQQLGQKVRTMKKTNSQYRLAVQDIFQQLQTLPETQKKKNKSKDNTCKNLLQWVDSWCLQNQINQPVLISKKDDEHLVNQWLMHLKNKYKLAKFIHQ